MKPLSEEELKKAADEAWEYSEHEGIDYLSFIDAFEKGYARCIRQMQDEFDELLKACHTALQNQTNVEVNEIINQMKGDATDKNRYFVSVDVGEGIDKTGFIEMQNK